MSIVGWGSPPWSIPRDIPLQEPPASCDVAVIGGGLAGLSASLHLARSGAGSVVLLEAGRLGAGASGRTGGIVLEGTAAGPLEGVDRCLAYLQQLVRENEIECDLRLPGCWELRHAPGESRQHSPSSSTAASAETTAAKLSNRARYLAGFAWQDAEALLCPVAYVPGGTVDAGALICGLARAASRAGVRLCEEHPVQSIELGDSVELELGGVRLRAGYLVLALNAYTEALLPLPVRLQTALTLAVCTEPLGERALTELGLDPPLPFYTQDLPYLWGRTLPDTGVIFGAGLVLGSCRELVATRIDNGEAARLLHQLEERIRGFHPVLHGVRFTHRWGGPIAFTAKRIPVLSRLPGHGNVIVTAGCAGHGIALAVQIGALIASAICKDKPLPAWGELPQ